MEKQGVIAPGLTPRLEPQPAADEKTSSERAINILDSDFRKQAADSAAKKSPK